MQLTTERQDLLNLLAKLIPVVNRKNTIPILANIVLSADEYRSHWIMRGNCTATGRNNRQCGNAV
jgi:hypothetical protein